MSECNCVCAGNDCYMAENCRVLARLKPTTISIPISEWEAMKANAERYRFIMDNGLSRRYVDGDMDSEEMPIVVLQVETYDTEDNLRQSLEKKLDAAIKEGN
jgi:hypothetical protein